MMRSLLVVLHAVWLGAHVVSGYVVAPLLFQYSAQGLMTKATAGNIAGDLFDVVMYVGLASTVAWWFFCRSVRQPSKVLNLMIVLIALSLWVITPVIEALKQQHQHWLLNLSGGSFAVWHGISSSLYLILTILMLIWTWQRLQVNSQRR